MTRPFSPGSAASIDTTSLTTASEHIASLYGNSTTIAPFELSSKEFAYRFKSTKLREVLLFDTEVWNWTLNRTTDNKNVSIMLPVTGGFTYREGRQTGEHAALKSASVGRPNERVSLITRHGRALGIYSSLRSLLVRAERLLDENVGANCEMAAQVDLSSPAGKALSRNMRTAFTEAQSLSALGIGAVALAGYEEVLLNLTVAAIFPDIGGRLLEPQPDCGSAATRRARDYLREHASELVEISQLAESLGVSMRSLQESFRRQFGVSPREYLFDCRLENARKLLLASDSASVTSVALNSGFNDLSQFAAKYQGRYGELPSKTFRRIRGGINAMAENALIIAPLP